jgi:hypothetical protein
MSTLVDHYLLQLKSLLPAKQRDDIAAELRESIASAVEERERVQGRALTDAEINDVLRGFGHPMIVAGRYLPMQQLIGPDVFPLYWYVLQAMLMVIGVVAGLSIGVALLTAPNATQAAWQVAVDFWWLALQGAALVTLSFAALDYGKARFAFMDSFDAAKAGGLGIFGVRAAPLSPIPRSDTVFEIATTGLLLLWWVEWVVFPSEWLGVVLRLSPAVEPFFYPVLVLCAVELVRLGVDLARPYRTVSRVALRLVLNLAWLALFVLAFRTEGLVEIAENVRSENPERVLGMAQTSMHVALFGLALVCAALAATDVVRLFRR